MDNEWGDLPTKYSNEPEVEQVVRQLADEYAQARDYFKANPDSSDAKAAYEAATTAFDNARESTYPQAVAVEGGE